MRPMTVGVYMLRSAMRAVGSSEVTIDWATGLATRKSATAATGPSARR